MRPGLKILLLGAIFSLSAMVSSSATAKPTGYCLECHSSKYLPALIGSFPAGDRSVYQAKLEPCPGVRSLSEEIFFTESRIVKINEILREMRQEGWATDSLRKKVSQTGESFSHLKSGEIISLSQSVKEFSSLRSLLQKVYDQTLQARGEADRRWLIGVGVLLFIGVMVLLGVGFKKLNRMGKALVLTSLMAGGLSISACSSNPDEQAKKSPAQEQLEQSLSVATHLAGKVEESLYRAALLAEMAREWSKLDPVAGDKAFQLAWEMALTSRKEAGEIRSLEKFLSLWPNRTEAKMKKVNYDAVLDLRDEIRNADGRAWALRAVAEEWLQARDKKGRQALEFASQKALEIKDPEVRDRDLKSLAEAWAGLDENRAWEISRSIGDPFLKSMALANLALTGRNQDRAGNILREAWKMAQSILPPHFQSKAFIRIAIAGAKILPQEKKYWAEQVMAQVQTIKNPHLQNLVLQAAIFEWAGVDGEQAERWAVGIPPEFSEPRAYSFLFLSQRPGLPQAQALTLLHKAVAETERVKDPFESQKIKNLVGKGLTKVDLREAMRFFPQIEDPFYRSEILSEMAGQLSRNDPEKALGLAERIPLEALRARMMVRIIGQRMERDRERVFSLYREALQTVPSISDPDQRAMSLIELGKEWGRWERGREANLFELALKGAEQISSPSPRGEIVEFLAAAWKESDPAKGRAVGERISPSLIGARRSLAEVRLWAQTDPVKARQWAEAIPAGFHYEKALAYKEVAVGLKKTQPASALGALEKALQQVLALPEGPKPTRLLSEIFAESASLDKDWTWRKLSQWPDPQMRDALFMATGGIWAKEDPLQALKAAKGVGESSLRQTLYQKIAEGAFNKLSQAKADQPGLALLSALASWGGGREKAKREETQAVPFYEKALREIEKVADPLEKAYLLGGLAAEWAPIDEEKALKVAVRISPSGFSEPLSYALLQVGAQYKKWNRTEAESLFQKTLAATDKLGDALLRAQRLLQLAQQWKGIHPEKGKEVLLKAEREARRITPPGKREPLLTLILQTHLDWEPENSSAISRRAGSAFLQTKILLEGAKVLRERTLEGNLKALEKNLPSAQKEKNFRLMGEVAVAWFSLVPQKGLEICAQIEPREIRIETLRQMARAIGPRSGEEAKHILGQATDEALAVDGLTPKIKLLKEIAHDWARIDKEKANATYLKAYQIAERETLSSPKF